MRENYNSFDYWENVIRENKTIRGHMFMQKPPTEKCLYFHTLIFSKSNGINNIWGYFPNVRSLIGYLQYSFLQESFYKWIHGKDKLITKIPSISVERIIEEGQRTKKITKEIADNMKKAGGFIPGIRPGKPTSDYLNKILNYIVLIGAVGLSIVAVVPIIFNGVFGANVSFGGTSIIIVVGVIIETLKQVESLMRVRFYKGFLND